MTNIQMITLMVTILGSNFGVLIFLSGKIDRLAERVDRLADKLDKINETLGRHDEAINTLKKQAEGPHIIPAQRS